jgi:predicted lipoprotein with Yx(FWY)xxD motif
MGVPQDLHSFHPEPAATRPRISRHRQYNSRFVEISKGMSAVTAYAQRIGGIWKAGAAIVAAGLLAAACSSSGGGSNSAGGAASTPPAASGVAAKTVTVQVRSGPYGKYLTDGKGMTLYMFASDTSTKSSCNAQCLTYWPALNGTAKAGTGVQSNELSSITTAGAKQVVYNGHPLYFFFEDHSPGEIKGQGSTNFGAAWWLLTPAGKAITKMAPGSGSSSSASTGGGGGGYGGGGGGVTAPPSPSSGGGAAYP